MCILHPIPTNLMRTHKKTPDVQSGVFFYGFVFGLVALLRGRCVSDFVEGRDALRAAGGGEREVIDASAVEQLIVNVIDAQLVGGTAGRDGRDKEALAHISIHRDAGPSAVYEIVHAVDAILEMGN